MKIHELKILPQYFDEIKRGDKTFELRKNDRDYKKGDILLLKEWNPDEEYLTVDDEVTNYTGKKIVKIVTSILTDIDSAVGSVSLNDYVILSIKDIDADVQLEWKSDMNEWGEIYCPFLDKSVMTYYPNGSRPYDTVTSPFLNEDGDVYFYKYDHDEGGWNDETYSMCEIEEYIHLDEVLWY